MATSDKRRLNVDLSAERYGQLVEYADGRGVTISQATREILDFYFYARPLMEHLAESTPGPFEDRLRELRAQANEEVEL